MAVIIDEIIAEPPQTGAAYNTPLPAPGVAPDAPVQLEQLRFDMLRDAHRQARIWVD